ncbi:conserved hypothetical protein [Verticillium alfalfae VaMs.102]|uniref:ADA HAT complex component 1 n=1 Tax=Verticillium alfalfae (strain VaMs.102 / ATCC MYA-4576 / FGSC 10136) TaxID=526221 RepID=C9S622_VERA1|nr:conserved hypothetical protein [Verticillium alfalfae VaMs.102]EEY14361.1 conserved hypothetical protein [Verticillium alfalfae VaMs.102]
MDAPIAADVTPLSAGAVETIIQTEPAPSIVMPTAPAANDLEKARDAIHYQFGLEILLKHDELRLVDQELAKCQVALEQLRRCHLIPYPVTCPTPEQMATLSSGKGPAVQPRPGEMVPEWAPPFGVVDGPYARHYAKWLIPDPKFDGMQPEWHPVMETVGRRTSAEGRTTRNSIVDFASLSKPRSGRGMSHHKLQSLSNGYPQPKEKAGPCVLKRSDGQTVKLVCIDCQRDNFSTSKARLPQMGFASPTSMSDKDDDRKMLLLQDEDVDMDADMSPNTMVSNNAPSLVSDDGEYDDSDDGSSMSDVSDGAESVSDVAEINIDEDSEPRSLRHHRTSSGVVSGAVRLKKEESKHVTFVSPVNKSAKRARKV